MSVLKSTVLKCDGCGVADEKCENWTRAHSDAPDRVFNYDFCPGCWIKMCIAVGARQPFNIADIREVPGIKSHSGPI